MYFRGHFVNFFFFLARNLSISVINTCRKYLLFIHISFCIAICHTMSPNTILFSIFVRQILYRIQSLYLYFITIVPFWLRSIRFLIQNTRSLFYGGHYSSLHRLMSLYGKLDVKIFLMFIVMIVTENTRSVNIAATKWPYSPWVLSSYCSNEMTKFQCISISIWKSRFKKKVFAVSSAILTTVMCKL